MILEDMTREERLLVNLIKASCAGRQSRMMDQFFDDLDVTGWLIELARVHVRLTTGVSFQHGEFAAALQLHRGQAYRLVLVQDTPLRSYVLAVARLILSMSGENIVTQAQRTKAYQNLQIELGLVAGNHSRRRGRRPGASEYAACTMGIELERLRVAADLKLKEWATRIGTSENTYRQRLIDSDIPPEWLGYAQIVVKACQDLRLELAASAVPPVRIDELQVAFNVVWQAYLKRMGVTPAATVPAISQEEQWRRDDEELLKFIPSPESDEDGNITEGVDINDPDREIEIVPVEGYELTPEELEDLKRRLKEKWHGSHQ